jgi:DNA-binding Lrp family transcriptional regulator
MTNLDKKNQLILNMLQENCRMSLTEISKKVRLSVDSVKKRIKKMLTNEIFYPKIQLRPRHFGFPNLVDVRIKLHNHNQREIQEFVTYLKENPYVIEVFTLSGEWNFAIVFIAKDFSDIARISEDIRNRFGKIINDWSESLTTCVHKFERYDMLKIMGDKI